MSEPVYITHVVAKRGNHYVHLKVADQRVVDIPEIISLSGGVFVARAASGEDADVLVKEMNDLAGRKKKRYQRNNL